MTNLFCDTGRGDLVKLSTPMDPEDPGDGDFGREFPACLDRRNARSRRNAGRGGLPTTPSRMCIRPEFLNEKWASHGGDDVDPNEFATATYRDAIMAGHPRYAAMGRNWGVTVAAADVATTRDASDVTALVAEAIGKRRGRT